MFSRQAAEVHEPSCRRLWLIRFFMSFLINNNFTATRSPCGESTNELLEKECFVTEQHRRPAMGRDTPFALLKWII